MGEEDASAYGVSKERTMAGTPTWAVAAVCFVILFVSIFIEQLLHLVGHWLKKKDKPALYEALEKIKAELMLLGFISLILVVVQDPISAICVSKRTGDSWLPCALKMSQKKHGYKDDKCTKKGKIAFMSSYAIHQLHIFIFVLALFHVLYCITTLALGRLKMKRWKAWEDETKTLEYQYSHDPERFRFARDTSFGRRHLNFWSRSTILLWIVCFFRQFFRSVTKVDYLTLRHGFIAAHLAPGSDTRFDFQKYISRSLEEDFEVVVSISPIFWVFAVFYLLTNTNGWRSYLWLPFIPLVIILLVSTKLQVIISKMGLAVIDRGDVVKGTPIVQPGDDLFWFNRPRLMLFLINFVLFQNAFQLAFFVWSWYTFGLQSCFHEKLADVIIRISLGIIIHVICSYVTLPLYAIVTQMGSTMRPTIFNDKVASALKNWHKTAKKHTKHGGKSEATTPLTSRPTTPTHGMSPVHLLHNYRRSDGYQTSPTHSNADFEDHWDGAEGSASPSRHEEHVDRSLDDEEVQHPPHPREIRTQHEIDMSNFSFGNGKDQMNR